VTRNARKTPEPVLPGSRAPENEQLRLTLGPNLRALAADIEAQLPFWRKHPEESWPREWKRTLEEMRRGLSIVSRAVGRLGDRAYTDLPDSVPIVRRLPSGRVVTYEARFFTPQELYSAQEMLAFWLGPPPGAHRPRDERRVWIGVRLAAIFARRGERVTLGRSGLFAETLAVVLEALGEPAPADPLRLLQAIRAAHRQRMTLPACAAEYGLPAQQKPPSKKRRRRS
jgi:hypothetical protein